MTRPQRALVALAVVLSSAGCVIFKDREPRAPAPPPEAEPTPLPPVAQAVEPVIVRAWAEPRLLPPAGGQSQILVLARKRNGDPFEAVEVQFVTDEGTLFSQGKILLTDAAGRTRDRLTTRRSATVTVNAGGTRQQIQVTVAGGR